MVTRKCHSESESVATNSSLSGMKVNTSFADVHRLYVQGSHCRLGTVS